MIKNRSFLYIAVAVAVMVASVLFPANSALAAEPAQVIVELQCNRSSSKTYAGNFSSQSIKGASASQEYMFQRQREGKDFSYVIANLLPNTTYIVELNFVEHDKSNSNHRRFNAYIEGQKVLSLLDIYSLVGANYAYRRSFHKLSDSGGRIAVRFRSDEYGGKDYATISTIRLLRSNEEVVEIDASASRHSNDAPIRYQNNINRDLYETVLGRLGSRYSINFVPQRMAARISPLGTYAGDLSELILAAKRAPGDYLGLPFSDRFKLWDTIQQSITMTGVKFVCSSIWFPFQVTYHFRAPFYPGDEQVSLAPFFYLDVTVKNTGSGAISPELMIARPHRYDHSASSFQPLSTSAYEGFSYESRHHYHDETYNTWGEKTASEALAIPQSESSDVAFKGTNQADFQNFDGDSIWGWNSPPGYPSANAGTDYPPYTFYPRGYSGAVWTVSSLVPGETRTKHFVLAAHTNDQILRVSNSSFSDSNFKLRYNQWWNSAGDVVNYAVTNRDSGARIISKCNFFDSAFSNNNNFYVSGNYLSDLRDLIAFSFQSYIANTWWAKSSSGRDWFSVWEGNFLYHSTVDVEYNSAWFYLDLWPGLLRKTLSEWTYYKKENAQGKYLSHDMGSLDAATGQAYPFDMPVEENTDFILLLYQYWKRSGDTGFMRALFYTVREFVDFIAESDTNGNGLPDLNMNNTIDQGSAGLQRARDQTYLGVKILGAARAAGEMALAQATPDTSYYDFCDGLAEQIEETLEYDLWLSDHFALCLDGGIPDENRRSYSIFPSNGLVYLLAGNPGLGPSARNRDRISEDLVNATARTLKAYGSSHSTYDSGIEWVSQNIWRDIAAAYLRQNINGSSSLALSGRYWDLQQYFATQLNGTFWDSLYYPGATGNLGASVREEERQRGGMVPQRSTEGMGGSGSFQQYLGYYPRGIASLGLIDAAAGLVVDKPGGKLRYRAATYPLTVPVLAYANWDESVESKRLPTINFQSSGSANISNGYLLPYDRGVAAYRDLENVTVGDHALSPNGDGINDTLEISYDLPVSSHMREEIWEGNTRTKVLREVGMDSGSKVITWDGKDESGDMVGDGVYTARIRANPYPATTYISPAGEAVGVNTSIPDLSNEWYLAEGFTGSNHLSGEFQEWLLIQNPHEQEVTTDITFMLPDGATNILSYQIAPHSRFTLEVDSVLPNAEVSIKVVATMPVAVERAMYFSGRRAGHAATGVTAPAKAWYLAEGYTAQHFDEYILVQNPGDQDGAFRVTYMVPSGETMVREYTALAHSRSTIHVDDILPEHEVSAKIESTIPVVVERAQYLNNMASGTCSIAARSTSETWFLAEGTTDWGFEEWVLIQNPQEESVEIVVTFMEDTGENFLRYYDLPAESRYTISIDEILEASDLSIKVKAERPILVERAMYWNNRSDGHAYIGTPTPDSEWYFAEGYTDQGWETWLLVQNPGGDVAQVEFAFMERSGQVTELEFEVSPRSRFTLSLDEYLPASEVSTRITADVPIICERAVYFNNRSGGTDSLGIRGY